MSNLARKRPPTATHTLRLIMIDPEDPRAAPTTPAPAPLLSESPTNPRASEAPMVGPKTMLPADGRTPSDFKDVAANDVIAGQRHLQASLEELLGPGGRLEQQTAAIAAVVDAAATRQMQSYDLLRQDMLRRFELTDARDKDQDAKLASVTTELASLTGRIDTIERAQLGAAFQRELGDIRASVLSLIDAVEAMGGADKTELSGRKVLLVDDHDLIRKSLGRVLGTHGATVFTASTRAAAQLLVEQFDPDCVVVDVRLAEGEDGTAIVEWLLARGFDRSRLLLMTGDPRAGVEAAQRLGVVLIEKPLGASDLVRVVREASKRPS